MKNLLYGAFTTLVMFGLGRAIYERGKKDAYEETRLNARMELVAQDLFSKISETLEQAMNKSKDESK